MRCHILYLWSGRRCKSLHLHLDIMSEPKAQGKPNTLQDFILEETILKNFFFYVLDHLFNIQERDQVKQGQDRRARDDIKEIISIYHQL